MSAQFTPQTAASESMVINAAKTPQTPQQILFAHLREYPIVVAAEDAIEGIHYPKRLVSAITPTLESIRNSTPVKQILDRGDNIANSALNEVDKYVPQLKTLTPHDLTDPIVKPIENLGKEIEKVAEGIEKSLDDNVVQPIRKAVESVCDRIHSTVYDGQTVEVVETVAEPIVVENVPEVSHHEEVPKPAAVRQSRFGVFGRHS